MALINCPECGKEIYDKSNICIHCGYPINDYICMINNNSYNLLDEYNLTIQNDMIHAIMGIRKKTSMSIQDAKELFDIMDKTKKIPSTFTLKYPLDKIDDIYPQLHKTEKNSQLIKCPTCQSPKIKKIGSLERVGSVAMLGIFSKKINKSFKCNSCGYTW